MANKPFSGSKSETKDPVGFYKGYNIDWLRSVKEEHPDGFLVDEYDKKNKEVNDNG